VFAAERFGQAKHDDSQLNLEADSACELQAGAEHVVVARIWKQMAKIDPPYDDYQKRAGERQILVVLDPVD